MCSGEASVIKKILRYMDLPCEEVNCGRSTVMGDIPESIEKAAGTNIAV
jgi:hypothetical protein